MDTTAERSAIEKLILSFSEAFNAADLSQVVSSYSPAGLLMPNNGPSAKGHDQIKASYESLFKAFQIHIEYAIEEVIVSGDYAFARTNSMVKTLIQADGATVALENKELFVLLKASGQWKIAHYIFNNTNTIK